MIMTVPVRVTQRGNISEGKTPKNDLTSFNVHNISVVVIIFLNIRRDRSRGIYANRMIVFEIEYTRDGFR